MDFKKAMKEVDKMTAVCEEGKDEIRQVLAALCCEEIDKSGFNSSNDNMEIYSSHGGTQGVYRICNAPHGNVCRIEDGYLVLNPLNAHLGLKKDSSGRIIIKGPATVKE